MGLSQDSEVNRLKIINDELLFLIDANEINFHGGGEDGIVDALLSAPAAADRNIEQKKMRLVERPIVRVEVFWSIVSQFYIGRIIEVKLQLRLGPFQTVRVKFFFRGRKLDWSRFDLGAVAVIMSLAVNRAVNVVRQIADVLHDVEFATVGPTRRPDVFSEHPDRRPEPFALMLGQFGTNFHAAKRERVACCSTGSKCNRHVFDRPPFFAQ